eukprot:COSAG02_NODE_2412_length_8920_cov_2.506178_6_plen_65_part_00
MHHESFITRGLFVIDLSPDGSSRILRSHEIAWTEEDTEPRIESMGVFADPLAACHNDTDVGASP